MEVTVSIPATVATPHEAAAVAITGEDGFTSNLYFDFTELMRSVPRPSEASQDFLLLAATAYALDKLVARTPAPDAWTREFDVSIPVSEPSAWSAISSTANECLSFLSGDRWTLHFVQRESPLIRRKLRKRRSRIRPRTATGAATCLFSGGLDSLVGAIDWLESNPAESLALVGHHDPGIGGPLSDQESLRDGVAASYRDRLTSVFIGIGHAGKAQEITMRSRSLLFVALGLAVADQLGDGTSLLIPENGTIALNVPLTPSRRGSCSTRTAHPFYLAQLQKWIAGVGLNHPLVNPLIGKTKGETVIECQNRALLEGVFRNSVSCAKRGHTSTWINRSANGCGRCMPCIYRRAALHRAGLDDEQYGVDMCQGEVDWTNPGSEAADDLRACLSFLGRNASQTQIAKMLVANGHLPPLDALEHAGTVQRAMDEIRTLLADKGTAAIKGAAGLGGRAQRAN